MSVIELGQRSLTELRFREQVALACIKQLGEISDERKDDAIDHYKSQLAEIREAIKIAEKRPPDIVVQLKTATLSGDVPK